MSKKKSKSKFLIFVLVGLLTFGAFSTFIVGASGRQGGSHLKHDYKYSSNGNGTHIAVCEKVGCETTLTENCSFKDGKCFLCGSAESAPEKEIVDSVLAGEVYDVEWEVGTIDPETGLDKENDISRRSTGYIESTLISIDVDFENIYQTYGDDLVNNPTLGFSLYFYDANRFYLSSTDFLLVEDLLSSDYTRPDNAYYVRLTCYLFGNTSMNASLDSVIDSILLKQI